MDKLYARIFRDDEFQALQKKRNRLSWVLAAIMFGSYVVYIMVIAFKPQWLAEPVSTNSVITWGIPVAVGVMVLGFVLTGFYVWRSNGEFDTRAEAILERLKDDE